MDPAVDVYSFGALLLQVLTGRDPTSLVAGDEDHRDHGLRIEEVQGGPVIVEEEEEDEDEEEEEQEEMHQQEQRDPASVLMDWLRAEMREREEEKGLVDLVRQCLKCVPSFAPPVPLCVNHYFYLFPLPCSHRPQRRPTMAVVLDTLTRELVTCVSAQEAPLAIEGPLPDRRHRPAADLGEPARDHGERQMEHLLGMVTEVLDVVRSLAEHMNLPAEVLSMQYRLETEMRAGHSGRHLP